MNRLSRHRAWIACLLGFAAACACHPARADVVIKSGYDLFSTVTPGTTFGGVEFQGVPLSTYDFGGTIGIQNVGVTDTIVHRLTDAAGSPGGQATIPIEMLSLQLQSVAPVDFGLGLDFYYLTLQTTRGGPATAGQMVIKFNGTEPVQLTDSHGTFDSFFDVFFDVRKGSLTGAIVLSDHLVLSSSGTSWSHKPVDPNVIQIPGVNQNLNGTNPLNDFFPSQLTESHPSGAKHVATPAAVPEPSTLVTGGLVFLFGAVLVGKSRKRCHQ